MNLNEPKPDYSQADFLYTGIKPTAQFKTQLYPHQMETVEWMMHREEIRYENIRGGLVLLDMGLGKTLCALACSILAQGKTLIVVPPQLVYVWESELNRHFHTPSYFVYHGTGRREKFNKYHTLHGDPQFLIVSFASMSHDVHDPLSPFPNFNFHRIIFDECQYIKNRHSLAFQAVSTIPANVKWFLSGTPIMNKIQEMYPYLSLLHYKKINEIPTTIRMGRYNYNSTRLKKDVYTKMQDLLKVISIRRTKEILDLPSKTYQLEFVTLATEERLFYNAFKEYSKNRVKKLMVNIQTLKGSGIQPEAQNAMRLLILQSLLMILLHLRLSCCDPMLVIDKIPRTRGMDVKSATSTLCKQSTNDCPVCCNNEATMENKNCGHRACPECWGKLAKMEVMMCFQCMEPTDTSFLHDTSMPNMDSLRMYHNSRITYCSSKTRSVLDLLYSELDKGHKVIVVSQWTSYLDLMMSQFRKEKKMTFCQLDGRTVPKKRQKTVDEFQDNVAIQVCFASLGSSAEGITLHSACTMIVCDVYWNQAKIEQVSDRIHRIGQNRDVIVYSMLVSDSIEMKMKELVDKKDAICKVVIDCAPITDRVESWLTKIIKLVD